MRILTFYYLNYLHEKIYYFLSICFYFIIISLLVVNSANSIFVEFVESFIIALFVANLA